MSDTMGLFPLDHITEEDFNFAMGFTNESPLQKRLKEAAESFKRQYRQLRQADGDYYEDNGPDSKRDFHLFPKMPAELQIEVWRHAVKNLPVSKVQAFDVDLAYDADAAPVGRDGNGVIACFKPKYTRALTGHRALLMACVDSRKAFLDSSDYTMLPLKYLVGPPAEKKEPETFVEYVEKSNKSFDNMCTAFGDYMHSNRDEEDAAPKVDKTKTQKENDQASQTFVHVVLPINLADTRFLIDKVAETFAYHSVHPAPPPTDEVFSQAAGLEHMHRVKRLAFCMTAKSWDTERIFSDLFATTAEQSRSNALPAPCTLGALEELSYVSARAFRRQCCVGHDHVWAAAPKVNVRTFRRPRRGSEHWPVLDLYQLHTTLMGDWKLFNKRFNLRWAKAMRQKCTCRR